ncbi:hypothetical protein CCMA1212_004519 [Trichoderma ghanense]|uniref:Uncharacterized protein n=1 Tax=Trichoderma ghanense TaxID=65468 RepID=A0ABY2H5K0_9HYPO
MSFAGSWEALLDKQNEQKKANARLGSSPQNDRRRLSNPQGCLATTISTTAKALEEATRHFVTDKSGDARARKRPFQYPLAPETEAHREETE